MPKWLIQLLRWGGLALAVIFAIALIWAGSSTPADDGVADAAPTTLYWVLLLIGIVAAVVGFVMKPKVVTP